MTQHDNTRPSARQPRSAFIPLIVAVAGAAAIALALLLSGAETRGSGEAQRPTGAGTIADGVADERIEGLDNQTTTDTFIDQSEASDTTPPLLDVETRRPEPAADATGLEPAVGNGEPGVEGIAPTQPEDDEDG